jgi:hypothetical protein
MERTTTVPGWGRGNSTRLPPGPGRYPVAPEGRRPQGLTAVEQGDFLAFSRKPQDFHEFVERSDRPVRGYAAGISGLGCSRFPGSIARWTNAERFWIIRAEKVFTRMINEPAFFNSATPLIRWIEGFEPS